MKIRLSDDYKGHKVTIFDLPSGEVRAQIDGREFGGVSANMGAGGLLERVKKAIDRGDYGPVKDE